MLWIGWKVALVGLFRWLVAILLLVSAWAPGALEVANSVVGFVCAPIALASVAGRTPVQ